MLNLQHRRLARVRGVSLVELMVGIAVGLFVVAAAALMTSSQLADNRRLLLETQLQQDLRATADIITRDMRRGGFWDRADRGVPLAAPPNPSTAPASVTANPYDNLSLPSASVAKYAYRRSNGVESFGFMLNTNGVIQACQTEYTNTGCASGWQDLTDANTVEVTSFSVTEVRAGNRARADNTKPVQLVCPTLCSADPNVAAATACWPTAAVREFMVSITGRSRSDARVIRTISSSFKVRNLSVGISSTVPAGQACPALL